MRTSIMLFLAFILFGCSGNKENPNEIIFWHTQGSSNGEVLTEIINEFNARHADIQVKPLYIPTYNQVYQKTIGAIRAGKTPDLVVAYASMVMEYMKAGIVLPLDDFFSSAFTPAERDDFYAAFIESNRFPQFKQQLLSFPFTKSILMMYYNVDLLNQCGIGTPPASWSKFLSACKTIKAQIGITPCIFGVDPSTIAAMVYSRGGALLTDNRNSTTFGAPAGLNTFRFIGSLFQQALAFQIRPRSNDDRMAMAARKGAFMFRSSTSRPYLQEMVGKQFKLGMAMIPHEEGKPPATVQYGANICLFKSSTAREKKALQFIKYFTSPAVTAKWAIHTGYLPVRKSALQQKAYQAFLAEDKINGAALKALSNSRTEPNIAGWQAIRKEISDMVTAVIHGRMGEQEAVRALDKKAAVILGGGF